MEHESDKVKKGRGLTDFDGDINLFLGEDLSIGEVVDMAKTVLVGRV